MRHPRRTILVTLALASSIGCSATTQQPTVSRCPSGDLAVWAKAVPAAAARFRGETLVEGTTTTSEFGTGFGEPLSTAAPLMRSWFPSLSDHTIASFATNSATACSLHVAAPELMVVDSTELRRHFSRASFGRNQGWATFESKFPGYSAFATVSRPGFNPANDEAVVYVGVHCGMLCGWGSFIHLRKIDDRWSVHRVRSTWES